MVLPVDQREGMLAEPHVAVISLSRPGRAPLSVPIWYHYEAGGPLWLLTGAGSAKHRAMAVGEQLSLNVQRVSPTIRYVTVEAEVTSVEPAGPDDMATLAGRYLQGEALAGYLATAESDLGEHVRVELVPRHWLSADLG